MKALEDLVGKQFILDFLHKVTYLFDHFSYNFRTLLTMHVKSSLERFVTVEIRNKKEIRKKEEWTFEFIPSLHYYT